MIRLEEFPAFIFLLVFSFISFSCKATEPLKKLDYSDSVAVLCEVTKGEKRLKDGDILGALSLAKNLILNRSDIEDVKILYQKAIKKAKDKLQGLIEKKDWMSSKRFATSILTCEPNVLSDSNYQIIEDGIRQLLYEKHTILLDLVSPIQKTANSYNSSTNISTAKPTTSKIASSIEEMIYASITVFVDKGLKIENGFGYPDIVLGSGFFIDDEGYFITNYHVIQSEVDPKYEGYSKLYVKNFNGSKDKIPARVVGYDPLLDLALLKVQGGKPSYIFELGSSESLSVGSKIYAIGSPLGLERTITSGIVSSKDRKLLSVADVIQLDAAISPGSSGGPIVDEEGAVQGIVFAGITKSQGLNFAIPVELLKTILPSLYLGGKVVHPWLAGFGKDIDEEDDIPFTEGVIASYIMPLGPAHLASLEEGSVITALNDVEVKNLSDLKMLLLSLSEDSIASITAKVKIQDEWEEKKYYVLLKERPEFPSTLIYKRDIKTRTLLPFFGLKLEYTGSNRYYRVGAVLPNSYGDEAGFMVNDYLELRSMNVNEDNGLIQVLFYAKKLKAAYVESFIGAASYGDSSGYF